jgi:hypothetical protein
MIAAGYKLAAICQRHSKRWLNHTPVRQHPRLYVAAIPALALSAVNRIPNAQLLNWAS